MSLRSLLSRLRYARSRHERPEEAGLIISRRLKDLLATTECAVNTTAQVPENVRTNGSGSVDIQQDDNPPAVKNAA